MAAQLEIVMMKLIGLFGYCISVWFGLDYNVLLSQN